MSFVVERLTDVSVALPTLQRLADLTVPAPNVAEEAKLPYAEVWVAHDGSPARPWSYVLAWLVADEVQIIDLATAPEARRRGAARALLRQLARRSLETGRTALFLEVRASNMPAIQLYASFGFEVTRVRRGYYADGEDGLEMRCDV